MIPEINKTYRHKNSGKLYLVITIANRLADIVKMDKFPMTVVYQRLDDNSIWSRSVENFFESFELCNETLEEYNTRLQNAINKFSDYNSNKGLMFNDILHFLQDLKVINSISTNNYEK